MAKGTNELTISSLAGGMNDSDPPHSLPDDQCVFAENVEFFESTLGERRKGMSTVPITDSGLDDEDVVVFLGTHQPAQVDIQDSEIWAVAATEDTSSSIAHRVDGTWHSVSPTDAFDNGFPEILRLQAQSLHNKYFIAGKTSKDRMHLWDGTTLRAAGLAAPAAAPTAADDAGAGSFADDRTYRVRFIEKNVDDEIVRRSEPSEELTFTPNGSKIGVTVTMPSAVNEGETHWELEASNGDGNFYIIATTVIGTTTVDDQNQPSTDYAEFELSEDIGDYELIPSAKYVIVDQDRPVFGGSWEDPEKGSRLMWTPVWSAPGVGNDERIPLDTDNFIDLDWQDGGELTGLSAPLNGSFYAFKLNRIYKVQRTGRVNAAYEAFLMSQMRGALPGSVISGVDEFGRGCVYFLDPSVGPLRIGTGGIQYMKNLRGTWARVNTSAEDIVCHGVYYPDKEQIHWWVAADSENTPSLKIICQVSEIRSAGGGTERGWTTANGHIAEAWCSCIVPEIIIDTEEGSTVLSFRPYAGFTSPDFIQRCDTESTDNGTAFRARIVTKPYIVAGLLNKWGAMNAALLATAVDDADVTLDVKFIRDFGKEENQVNTDFIPTGSESHVIRQFNELHMSESYAIQVEFSDPV